MTRIAIALTSTLALMSIAGCKKKGGDGGAGDAMAKMSEFKDKMCACKDADCAKKVSDEMTAWSQKQAQSQKEPAKMSDADQKKATEIGTQMGECMQKAMTPAAGSATLPAEGSGSDAAGSGSATTLDAATGLPPECADYKAAIDKLATCEKMSKQARETLVKAYADASAGWKALPDAAKERIGKSCKAGAEAVLSTGKAQCGW